MFSYKVPQREILRHPESFLLLGTELLMWDPIGLSSECLQLIRTIDYYPKHFVKRIWVMLVRNSQGGPQRVSLLLVTFLHNSCLWKPGSGHQKDSQRLPLTKQHIKHMTQILAFLGHLLWGNCYHVWTVHGEVQESHSVDLLVTSPYPKSIRGPNPTIFSLSLDFFFFLREKRSYCVALAILELTQ